jgi:hypothetical protein
MLNGNGQHLPDGLRPLIRLSSEPFFVVPYDDFSRRSVQIILKCPLLGADGKDIIDTYLAPAACFMLPRQMAATSNLLVYTSSTQLLPKPPQI